MLNAIPKRVSDCFEKTRKLQPSNSVSKISILKKDLEPLLSNQRLLRLNSNINDTS